MTPEHSRHQLGSHIRWSYLLHGGRMLATTLVTFVLAALLGPAAFGIIAVALVYVMFVQLLMQQGLLPALVQREGLTDEHKDVAFWLVVASGVVLAAVTVAVSGVLAAFYSMPLLQPVLAVLAVCLPIRAVTVVQEALLQREMRFKELAIRNHAAVLTGGAVGIVAAFAGAGVWALVGQQIITYLVLSVTLWLAGSWRPRLRWSSAAARDLIGFSSHSALSSIGVFFSNRADILVMGIFFTPVAVGLYRLSFRLVDTVVDVTARSMQTVSLSHLSRLQDDQHEFAARLARLLRLIGLLGLPALGVLAASAPAVVRVLGDDWEGATSALRLLCAGGALSAFSLLIGPVLQALGRPGVMAILAWSRAVLGVVAFAAVGAAFASAAPSTQVSAIAVAFVVLQAIVVCAVVTIVARRTLLGWRAQVHLLLPGLVVGSTAAATTLLRAPLGASTIHPIGDLAVTGVAAMVASAIVLVSVDADIRRALLARLPGASSSRSRNLECADVTDDRAISDEQEGSAARSAER